MNKVEPCKYCGQVAPRHREKERGCKPCFLENQRAKERRRREADKALPNERHRVANQAKEVVSFWDERNMLRKPLF